MAVLEIINVLSNSNGSSEIDITKNLQEVSKLLGIKEELKVKTLPEQIEFFNKQIETIKKDSFEYLLGTNLIGYLNNYAKGAMNKDVQAFAHTAILCEQNLTLGNALTTLGNKSKELTQVKYDIFKEYKNALRVSNFNNIIDGLIADYVKDKNIKDEDIAKNQVVKNLLNLKIKDYNNTLAGKTVINKLQLSLLNELNNKPEMSISELVSIIAKDKNTNFQSTIKVLNNTINKNKDKKISEYDNINTPKVDVVKMFQENYVKLLELDNILSGADLDFARGNIANYVSYLHEKYDLKTAVSKDDEISTQLKDIIKTGKLTEAEKSFLESAIKYCDKYEVEFNKLFNTRDQLFTDLTAKMQEYAKDKFQKLLSSEQSDNYILATLKSPEELKDLFKELFKEGEGNKELNDFIQDQLLNSILGGDRNADYTKRVDGLINTIQNNGNSSQAKYARMQLVQERVLTHYAMFENNPKSIRTYNNANIQRLLSLANKYNNDRTTLTLEEQEVVKLIFNTNPDNGQLIFETDDKGKIKTNTLFKKEILTNIGKGAISPEVVKAICLLDVTKDLKNLTSTNKKEVVEAHNNLFNDNQEIKEKSKKPKKSKGSKSFGFWASLEYRYKYFSGLYDMLIKDYELQKNKEIYNARIRAEVDRINNPNPSTGNVPGGTPISQDPSREKGGLNNQLVEQLKPVFEKLGKELKDNGIDMNKILVDGKVDLTKIDDKFKELGEDGKPIVDQEGNQILKPEVAKLVNAYVVAGHGSGSLPDSLKPSDVVKPFTNTKYTNIELIHQALKKSFIDFQRKAFLDEIGRDKPLNELTKEQLEKYNKLFVDKPDMIPLEISKDLENGAVSVIEFLQNMELIKFPEGFKEIQNEQPREEIVEDINSGDNPGAGEGDGDTPPSDDEIIEEVGNEVEKIKKERKESEKTKKSKELATKLMFLISHNVLNDAKELIGQLIDKDGKFIGDLSKIDPKYLQNGELKLKPEFQSIVDTCIKNGQIDLSALVKLENACKLTAEASGIAENSGEGTGVTVDGNELTVQGLAKKKLYDSTMGIDLLGGELGYELTLDEQQAMHLSSDVVNKSKMQYSELLRVAKDIYEINPEMDVENLDINVLQGALQTEMNSPTISSERQLQINALLKRLLALNGMCLKSLDVVLDDNYSHRRQSTALIGKKLDGEPYKEDVVTQSEDVLER